MGHHTTFQEERLALEGAPLHVGDHVPSFTLTGTDMNDVRLSDFAGKTVIISSVPSIDTPVCALETKRFNSEAARRSENITILTVSMDLPFAQKRWCGAEGVESVVVASDFKYRDFGKAFGVGIPSWGLLARAVFVIDPRGKVAHVEYVSRVEDEPNYEAALTSAERAAAELASPEKLA